MRSPDAINERLQVESESHNVILLYLGLNQNVNEIASMLSETYLEAFQNALRHRPNGTHVDKLATLAWLAGSDLNVADVPWMQFGMPRIRRLAIELQLPWVPVVSRTTLQKATRMSNGLPCEDRCFHCFKGR